jgi:hypothetical protein
MVFRGEGSEFQSRKEKKAEKKERKAEKKDMMRAKKDGRSDVEMDLRYNTDGTRGSSERLMSAHSFV